MKKNFTGVRSPLAVSVIVSDSHSIDDLGVLHRMHTNIQTTVQSRKKPSHRDHANGTKFSQKVENARWPRMKSGDGSNALV